MINDKQIAAIAAELEVGKRCYVHLETGDVVSIFNKPDNELDDDDQRNLDLVNSHPKAYKEFLPPSSTLVYKMMEQFTAAVEDFEKQSELMQTLSYEQPFANFRTKVYRLQLEKEWHLFRSKEFAEVVKKQA